MFHVDVKKSKGQDAWEVVTEGPKCTQSSLGRQRTQRGGDKQTQRRNNKECKTDMQGFLHLSFPLIRDAGMRRGEDKIQKNEVEVFGPLPHMLFDLHRQRSCCRDHAVHCKLYVNKTNSKPRQLCCSLQQQHVFSWVPTYSYQPFNTRQRKLNEDNFKHKVRKSNIMDFKYKRGWRRLRRGRVQYNPRKLQYTYSQWPTERLF